MTTEEFVRGFYQEKEHLLRSYAVSQPADSSHVTQLLAQLGLTPQQTAQLPQVLNAILTDAFYTMLLGLDGAASIGSHQEQYQIADEQGNELTGSGEIEAHAYDYFHGAQSRHFH
jgi:hypothetical protein